MGVPLEVMTQTHLNLLLDLVMLTMEVKSGTPQHQGQDLAHTDQTRGKLGVIDDYDEFGDHECLGEGENLADFGGVFQCCSAKSS